MKKILITLLFSVPVLAQNGFRASDRGVVWEKSFPADDANIVALLERQPNLKVASFMDNVYKGTGDQIKNNCESGSGLMKNDCKFDFLIMVNPDSYVVKLTNLKIIEKYGPLQAKTVANPCEKYFLGKAGLKDDAKTAADLNCLDNYLSGVFSMSGTSPGALTSN